jgi:hypothetical protein
MVHTCGRGSLQVVPGSMSACGAVLLPQAVSSKAARVGKIARITVSLSVGVDVEQATY